MLPGIVGITGLIAALVYQLYFRKNSPKTTDPWDPINRMRKDEYTAYVDDHLQNKRMIDDFVLTRAAFPIEGNDIVPQEGYSMTNDSVNSKTVYSFVAAVSAEKIWGLLLDFLERIGTLCIIDIESFEDNDNIILYRSAEMGTCYAVDVLTPFRDMIVNNCLLKLTISSRDKTVSLTLSNTKHIILQSNSRQFATALFELYRISSTQNLRLYTEKEFVYVYEWNTGVIHSLLQNLEIIETVITPRETYVS